MSDSSNPMDCNLPGPSVHRVLQARILQWVTLLQRIFLTHGLNPHLLHCRWILYRWATRKVPSLLFNSVQLLSCVRLFVTPWTAEHHASLSITNSWSILKLMSIELVMSSNHLILYHRLLLLPSIFPSIKGFFNESVLRIRWPKYWTFNFSIRPSNEYSGLISFRMAWFDLLAVQGTSLQVGWFE